MQFKEFYYPAWPSCFTLLTPVYFQIPAAWPSNLDFKSSSSIVHKLLTLNCPWNWLFFASHLDLASAISNKRLLPLNIKAYLLRMRGASLFVKRIGTKFDVLELSTIQLSSPFVAGCTRFGLALISTRPPSEAADNTLHLYILCGRPSTGSQS